MNKFKIWIEKNSINMDKLLSKSNYIKSDTFDLYCEDIYNILVKVKFRKSTPKREILLRYAAETKSRLAFCAACALLYHSDYNTSV